MLQYYHEYFIQNKKERFIMQLKDNIFDMNDKKDFTQLKSEIESGKINKDDVHEIKISGDITDIPSNAFNSFTKLESFTVKCA